MIGDEARERAQRSFTRRLLLLLGLGFAALIAAAGTTAWMQARLATDSAAVEHTLAVEAQIAEFATLNERVETARRGQLLGGGEDFGRIFETASAAAERALADLRGQVRDNPAQRARVDRLQAMVARQRAAQRASVGAGGAGEDFTQDGGVVAVRQIRALAAEMSADERALFAERSARQRETLRAFYVVLGIAGLLLVAVALATIAIVLRYTRDLGTSRRELRRLNDSLEDTVAARTAELQRANQEIQRFAYIVSHDLRSPLVNVMGFTAELDAARRIMADHVAAERAAGGAVPEPVRLAAEEDLPEAIAFIRTSTQKMDRLINAILRLSREGRRTLTPERIDMDAMVQGIFDNLHQRIAEAGASVHAEPLPDVVSDRVAIDQILSNLVENAVKYAAPGRPSEIIVSGRSESGRVVFEVADNGRGIDPRDHDRVFDLFRRSGAQDRPGEGIGLAHVRALAYRLGGVVDVRSELDRGATFRLSLPLVLDAREAAA